MPELRKDPITRRWVIIATERAVRPSDFAKPAPAPDTSATCPFCEGREERTPPEIVALRRPDAAANAAGWQVRAIPNRFPALRIEGSTAVTVDGVHEAMGGVGAHEVIIETPQHTAHPAVMPTGHLASVLWMYRQRYRDLDRDERFKYLLLFRNHGPSAGASLAHPHSQLIALPIVPKRVTEELDGARQYFSQEGRCVYCDVLRQEQREQIRVVWQNDDFIAFVPYSAWCAFEVWILPRAHVAAFGDITDGQLLPLAETLQQVLGRLNACLGNPPYNYVIHTAPYENRVGHFYHWHIEVIPRLSHVAGFEWGSGFYINAVPPEDSAKYLREVPQPAPVS